MEGAGRKERAAPFYCLSVYNCPIMYIMSSNVPMAATTH